MRPLIATAVYLGQSLGLDTTSCRYSPFDTQLRRRIWYSISILDLQAAFDGGSSPSLVGDALSSDRPLHVDDADISPNDGSTAISKIGFTDMTFPAMTHEMLHYMRRLAHVPVDYAGRPLQTQEWSERYSLVDECAQVLHDKYLQYCSTANAFHRFTKVVGQDMVTLLRLLVRRPLYRFYSAGPPPRDDFDILDVALNVLDRALQKYGNDDFRPWRWFSWIKWYALAVLLAELCEHTAGPQVDRAWNIAEAGFARYKAIIDDELVRHSIRRLMRRARLIRSSTKGPIVRLDALDTHIHTPAIVNDYDQNTNGVVRCSDEQVIAAMKEPEQAVQLDMSLDELEMQSWINWEAFVHDIGDSSHMEMTNELS